MGSSIVGRNRAYGGGQQDLAALPSARAASASKLIFQREAKKPEAAQIAVISVPAQTKSAQQAVTMRSNAAFAPKLAKIATGSVKDPALPSSSSAQLKPNTFERPKLSSDLTTSGKTRELLANPKYKAFIEERRPNLIKNMNIVNLDFLEKLKLFRQNPTLELALKLKDTYANSNNNQCLTMEFMKASDFNRDRGPETLNITEKVQKGFENDFDSCIRQLENGVTFNRSGMAHVFDNLELEASKMLLKDLQLY